MIVEVGCWGRVQSVGDYRLVFLIKHDVPDPRAYGLFFGIVNFIYLIDPIGLSSNDTIGLHECHSRNM